MRYPIKKRIFDLVVTILTSVTWIPVIFIFAMINLAREGFPIFYSSRRRVSETEIRTVYKFRTMVRHAENIYNRDVVPMNNVRFLNTPISSPLYTRTGLLIEKYTLTELPQFINVLQGYMSIVGNRPLPENVVESLSDEYPGSMSRFSTSAGMTGPTQLVGRSGIIDRDRLVLEITYCEAVRNHYKWRLDFLILLYTVLIALKIKKSMTVEETIEFMVKQTGIEYRFPPSLCGRKHAEGEEERVVWSDEQREWALNAKIKS